MQFLLSPQSLQLTDRSVLQNSLLPRLSMILSWPFRNSLLLHHCVPVTQQCVYVYVYMIMICTYEPQKLYFQQQNNSRQKFSGLQYVIMYVCSYVHVHNKNYIQPQT